MPINAIKIINVAEKDTAMFFLEVEKTERDTPWSMAELHSHSFYEFYFLQNGTRSFFIESALYTAVQNAVIIIPPYTMHKTEGGPFVRVNINVSENFFDKDELMLVDALAKNRILIPNGLDAKAVSAALEKLLQLQNKETKAAKTLLKIELKKLIADLYSFRGGKTRELERVRLEKDVPPIILNIIGFINDNFSQSLSLNCLADRFYISRGNFARMFKKHTGFSVTEYISNLRLNKAKQLLSSTSKSVEEISELLGFCSANYFGLIFKSKVGMSPLNYRKHERNKV